MSISTTVQPLNGRPMVSSASKHVLRLVESGGDVNAAESLVKRLTSEMPPNDIFEEAALNSFIELVVALSNTEGRLTSVS